jgi:iron complex outermembrane recepter protein
LLNRILSEQHGKRIAVIENEFGEIGIDQALVINADEEVFEMNNGCICRTVRGDLIRILGNRMKRRDKFDPSSSKRRGWPSRGAISAWCAALLFVCGIAPAARAQEPSPPPQVTLPEAVLRSEATYPPEALAARQEAQVVLLVTIGSDGRVADATVAESAGQQFDQAALDAIKDWRFIPARRGKEVVASRIRVPFRFSLPAVETEPAQPVASEEGSPEAATNEGTIDVTVRGKAAPPLRSTSDFRVDRQTLTAAPHASAADLLSTAPGFYIAHPEGEAVAQRVYVRGFDAEHGQDVEFTAAGIPINQPSHLHGQGYADLNLIIPEVVRAMRVVEGVYDPHQGDFAVAGSVDYELGVDERRPLVKLSYGSFNAKRLVGLWAPADEAPETFGAATFRTSDGFGDGTRGATAGGFLGQYQLAVSAADTLLFHAGGYAARSNLAGVLRRADIDAGRVGFYDAYRDPTARAQSAGTSRTQLGLGFEHAGLDGARLSAGLWTYLATFRSRMNFTGYVERSQIDPTWVGRGDLIEQSNHDLAFGGRLAYRGPRTALGSWLDARYELGGEMRTHTVEQAQNLLRAPQNETWDQRVDATVHMSDASAYLDGELSAGKFARLRGGARADLLFFDVDDRLGNFIPAFSRKSYIVGFRRTASGIAFGPRATLDVDPAGWLRLSAAYGEGYRSPQARQLEEGEQAPFARVKSYEVGATLKDGERVSLVLAAYETKLSYDLAFDAAEGRLERIGATTRRGLVGYVLANPVPWLHGALSATLVQATLDAPPIATPENPTPPYVRGQSLPYVPPLVMRADASLSHTFGTLYGRELTARLGTGVTFLSARPLPYSLSSPSVLLVDGLAALRRDWLELTLDAANVFGARYADSEYAFVSDWRTTEVPSRVPAPHITAGAPRSLIATLTLYL